MLSLSVTFTFSEFSGRYSDTLSELSAKMLDISIAALFGNFTNALVGISEQIHCFSESEINYIVHTGNTEFLFIKQLQMSHADVQ